MDTIVNRIRLSNNLWFFVQGNKIVFGDKVEVPGCHYTFSFGNLTGHFDLHLTKDDSGKHFTVLTVSHQSIAENLLLILDKIVHSVLHLEPINQEVLTVPGTIMYRFSEIKDVLNEFAPLIKKDRLTINKDSEAFRLIVERLVAMTTTTKVQLSDLSSLSSFIGILQTNDGTHLIVKNEIVGSGVFLLKDLDLDINSILSKVLGAEFYGKVLARIDEGIRTLGAGG